MSGPRISIVTVSLNQAATIASAVRSVLEQNQPLCAAGGEPVEYIVIDGGSTDGTRAIIEQYADHLSYWVSEPDRGQSYALNKGFARATGEVVGWLNADDRLMPGALARVYESFAAGSCDVLCGACRYEYPDGRARVQAVTQRDLDQLAVWDPIHQPSCLWRRDWHEHVGGLNEQLHYGMDWDLWLRLARAGARFQTIDEVLSVYAFSGVNKTATGGEKRNREMYAILREYGQGDSRVVTELAYRLLWPLKRLRARWPQWFFQPASDAARTSLLIALGPLLGFGRVRRCTHPFC